MQKERENQIENKKKRDALKRLKEKARKIERDTNIDRERERKKMTDKETDIERDRLKRTREKERTRER